MFQFHKIRGSHILRFARALHRYRYFRFDPARSRREYINVVGQVNRFIDVMRNEQHRFSKVGPNLQQPILHRKSGLCVKRAKRLVQ
ncbi:hypothetical protein D3C76_1433960 [compost metagenome]